jgi:hypothetical protein
VEYLQHYDIQLFRKINAEEDRLTTGTNTHFYSMKLHIQNLQSPWHGGFSIGYGADSLADTRGSCEYIQ